MLAFWPIAAMELGETLTREKLIPLAPIPAVTESVLTEEVTYARDSRASPPTPPAAPVPICAPAMTVALAPPVMLSWVKVAPTPTAPLLTCPVISVKSREFNACTMIDRAASTLPMLACTRPESLMTTTAAPRPTNPTAPSSEVTFTDSISLACTRIWPTEPRLPSASAATLSASDHTETEAPAPTRPPANWPATTPNFDCSSASTVRSFPACTDAPAPISAEVPGGAGLVGVSAAISPAWVSDLALTVMLAEWVVAATRLLLVLALPWPVNEPRPLVTRLVPVWDCWPALPSALPWPSPESTPLALLPSLSA